MSKSKKKLTTKRRKFVHEYIKDLNATQAAIRSGYSKKTAGSIGFDLLKIPEIQELLKEIQDKDEKKAIMGFDEAREILSSIGRGKAGDYQTEDGAIDPTAIQEVNPNAVGGMETLEVKGMLGTGVIKKIKLRDPKGAIELLGKMQGWQKPEEQNINIAWQLPQDLHDGQ